MEDKIIGRNPVLEAIKADREIEKIAVEDVKKISDALYKEFEACV